MFTFIISLFYYYLGIVPYLFHCFQMSSLLPSDQVVLVLSEHNNYLEKLNKIIKHAKRVNETSKVKNIITDNG